MRKACLLLIALAALAATPALAADTFPTTLAGFTLGASIDRYERFCRMDQILPVSDAPFLSEALIKPDALPGVRGGSLAFGNCKNDGRLVRIKLKFHDRGQALFEKLYERYVDAFGKPDKYKGDAFKNVISWQWLFENKAGERVSLELMWSRDKEVRPGVSIKMTQETLLDAESECHRAKYEKDWDRMRKTKVRSLDAYVPR